MTHRENGLTDLEVENSRLRKERDALIEDLEFLYALDPTCSSMRDGMNLTRACRSRAEAAEARLAEALKALDEIAGEIPGPWDEKFQRVQQIARRVREGGKIDG